MKNKLIFIQIIISLIFCSWTMRISTWSIRIGKKDLLTSQKNQMGDISVINTKKIKMTDTLFVSRYLCGLSGENSVTTLTIKNLQNEIIKEISNRDNGLSFTAKMPISDILNSDKYSKEQTFNVFFTIDSKTENLAQTVLLGKIKFK